VLCQCTAILNEQKDIASKSYFDKLIKTTAPAPTLTSSGRLVADESSELSPIEKLFHKHMKRSLMAYEDYYQV
jgi:hypothetical protein